MSFLKKFIATVTAIATMFAFSVCFTGCGQDTAYAITIDGTEVDAGVYIYYVYCAISDAQSELEEGQDLFGEGVTIGASNGEKMNANDWIQYKAIEYCCEYMATVKYADELGAKISSEQKKSINTAVDEAWESYQSLFENIGVSKSSFTKAYYNRFYLNDNIVQALYGKNGTQPISDDELMNYMVSILARVKISTFELKDDLGNALDASAASILEAKIQRYANRINNGETFDDVLDEINNVSSQDPTIGDSGEEDPYKNETWVYKESAAYSDAFKEYIFTPEGFGKAELYKDTDKYYLLQILNPRERTDYFEMQHDNILGEYKSGEVDETIKEKAKSYDIVLNDKAIKRYSAEKINKLANKPKKSNNV